MIRDHRRILVIGATGNIGRRVVAHLRAADIAVRALSRKPRSANLPDGIDFVRGDLTAPETRRCGANSSSTQLR